MPIITMPMPINLDRIFNNAELAGLTCAVQYFASTSTHQSHQRKFETALPLRLPKQNARAKGLAAGAFRRRRATATELPRIHEIQQHTASQVDAPHDEDYDARSQIPVADVKEDDTTQKVSEEIEAAKQATKKDAADELRDLRERLAKREKECAAMAKQLAEKEAKLSANRAAAAEKIEKLQHRLVEAQNNHADVLDAAETAAAAQKKELDEKKFYCKNMSKKRKSTKKRKSNHFKALQAKMAATKFHPLHSQQRDKDPNGDSALNEVKSRKREQEANAIVQQRAVHSHHRRRSTRRFNFLNIVPEAELSKMQSNFVATTSISTSAPNQLETKSSEFHLTLGETEAEKDITAAKEASRVEKERLRYMRKHRAKSRRPKHLSMRRQRKVRFHSSVKKHDGISTANTHLEPCLERVIYDFWKKQNLDLLAELSRDSKHTDLNTWSSNWRSFFQSI